VIKTFRQEDGSTLYLDQSRELSSSVLKCVQAGMRAGLTVFTTPTSDDDEKRIEWQVTRWVSVDKAGSIVCFLVAFQTWNAQFEVVGPEVKL